MDVTDSPPHATTRHTMSSPAPARSCLGLAGGRGSPLLGLVLPNCCALGFDRTQCGYSISTPTARTQNPKNPKMDSGVTEMTDSPPHATTRHAVSPPTPARSCFGLAGGRGSPPARPRATALLRARICQDAMRLLCFHPHRTHPKP